MKKFAILAILPLLFSGTTANIKMPSREECPCADSIDTLLPDHIKDSIVSITHAVTERKVDSFKAELPDKIRMLDSATQVADSLAIELRRLKKIKVRYVVMRLEELPSLSPGPHDGLIWWGKVYRGDTLFSHTEKVLIK